MANKQYLGILAVLMWLSCGFQESVCPRAYGVPQQEVRGPTVGQGIPPRIRGSRCCSKRAHLALRHTPAYTGFPAPQGDDEYLGFWLCSCG